MEQPQVILLMGVSGAGKTTIGVRLAERLGWTFYDGDDFHPDANVEKMSRGEALTDADRGPWLQTLHRHIADLLDKGERAVVACSALKADYREVLLQGNENGVEVVYLEGSYALIEERLRARRDHFFDADLLRSQFDVLEEPAEALIVGIDQTPEEVVREIEERLGLECTVEPSSRQTAKGKS